jgi:alpha-ribazole phosphatase
MILTAIRHTSVDVPSGICYGITDVPLAATFQTEASQIQAELGNRQFNQIYSSPLTRCTQLASSLFPEKIIFPDDRLEELDFGDWEMQEWNTIFNSPEGKVWFEDYSRASCPNGESFAYLVTRVKSFLDELKAYENEPIAIITHAGVIRALMCLLQQKTAEEAFNTSLKYGQIVNFDYNQLVTRNPQQLNNE